MFINRKNQSGDTIIEVLIAIAIMGAIIGSAYSIATRSLNSVRTAQERGEALKVAEGQVDQLRARLSTITDKNDLRLVETAVGPPFDPNTAYCFKSDGTILKYQLPGNDITKLDDYAVATPPATDCINNGMYYIAIQTDFTLSATRADVTYRVNVVWERAGGGGQEKLNLNYKITLTV